MNTNKLCGRLGLLKVLIQAGVLTSATSGTVSIGYKALNSLTSGARNLAIGYEAADALTSGNSNVAVGYGSLTTDTLGDRNVAIGVSALEQQNFTTSTDSYNVAVGYGVGLRVTTAVGNTLLGGLAGDGLTTGDSNVFVGYQTGRYLVASTTGAGNTLVGSYTYSTSSTGSGAQALGHSLAAAAGYTTVGYAGSDIRAQNGVATWATVSDERYKKDIVDSEAGLSFINALRPRTFKYKNLGELPETFRAYEEGSTEVFKNSETNHGFIAQEVKAAIDADNNIKDGFRLWDERDDGAQEVGEAALIPVLVKAIQELTARVAALES